MNDRAGPQRAIHIELLCGGGPGFEVADAVRDAVRVIPNTTCRIIHLDRDAEEVRGREDVFIAFQWDKAATDALLNDEELVKTLSKRRIQAAIDAFPPPSPPANNAFACRLATYALQPEIKKRLFEHFQTAIGVPASIYVAICVVPEGPTGTGVSWAFMDRLGTWLTEFAEQRAFKAAQNITVALLELVPARPSDDGDPENLLQGAVSRLRLHSRAQDWNYYWFRFDAGKLGDGLTNAQATRLGAVTFGTVLTSWVTTAGP